MNTDLNRRQFVASISLGTTAIITANAYAGPLRRIFSRRRRSRSANPTVGTNLPPTTSDLLNGNLTVENQTNLNKEKSGIRNGLGKMLIYQWAGDIPQPPEPSEVDVQYGKADTQDSTYAKPGSTRTITNTIRARDAAGRDYLIADLSKTMRIDNDSTRLARFYLRTKLSNEKVVLYKCFFDEENGEREWFAIPVRSFEKSDWDRFV